MTSERFRACLPLVLRHEGGWSDHPKDPGGATMRGVIQRTYDAWRRGQGLETRSVREIEDSELEAIYHEGYWLTVRADDLPVGLDYAVFDYSVNSGPGRAVRELQGVLGVGADGIVGPVTLDAVRRSPAVVTVDRLCAARMAFLRSLKHWGTFGKGWTRRVTEVNEAAISMARDEKPIVAAKPEATPSARPEDKSDVKALAKEPGAWAAVSTAVLTGLSKLTDLPEPIQWAVGAAIVMLAGVVAYRFAIKEREA